MAWVCVEYGKRWGSEKEGHCHICHRHFSSVKHCNLYIKKEHNKK